VKLVSEPCEIVYKALVKPKPEMAMIGTKAVEGFDMNQIAELKLSGRGACNSCHIRASTIRSLHCRSKNATAS